MRSLRGALNGSSLSTFKALYRSGAFRAPLENDAALELSKPRPLFAEKNRMVFPTPFNTYPAPVSTPLADMSTPISFKYSLPWDRILLDIFSSPAESFI